jgi:hypothetical protein
MMLGIQAKESNLGFIRPHMAFRCLLANTKQAVMCLFTEASIWPLPNMSDCWSAAEMVVLLKGSPIYTEELWSSVRVTIGFLVTSPTKAPTKALLPRLLSLGFQTTLGCLGGSELLPVKNGGHCVLVSFPDLCLH